MWSSRWTDVPVDPDNTQDAISRMRGEPGTSVTLDVMRGGVQDPLRFALTAPRFA